MSIIQLYTQELSTELNDFLAEIKPNVDRYTAAKEAQLKERMLIIGQVAEYREKFPQRSADHRLLSSAMQNEWNTDVIKKATAAYKEYKRLKERQVPEYEQLAEAANPAQLITLSRGEGTTLIYEAAKYLKQTGSVPSQGKLEQRLKGNNSASFEKCRTAPLVTAPNIECRTTAPPNINLVDNTTVTVSAEVVNTASPETTATFKTQQEVIAELVSDTNKPYLNDFSSACVYHSGGRIAAVKACAQHITEMSVMSAEMAKAVDELFHAVISLKGRSPALVEYTDMPIRGRR